MAENENPKPPRKRKHRTKACKFPDKKCTCPKCENLKMTDTAFMEQFFDEHIGVPVEDVTKINPGEPFDFRNAIAPVRETVRMRLEDVISSVKTEPWCVNCQKRAVYKCCSLTVCYCSKKCQAKHWNKGHKYKCEWSWSTSTSEDDFEEIGPKFVDENMKIELCKSKGVGDEAKKSKKKKKKKVNSGRCCAVPIELDQGEDAVKVKKHKKKENKSKKDKDGASAKKPKTVAKDQDQYELKDEAKGPDQETMIQAVTKSIDADHTPTKLVPSSPEDDTKSVEEFQPKISFLSITLPRRSPRIKYSSVDD